VTVKCLGTIDCPSGQSCCAIQNGFVFDSECQTVADGGHCAAPPPATSNQSAAQLCESTVECKNGAECIPQSCVFGAKLTLCGVQSASPYSCAATDAGLTP
jgi:hypothetical protein